MTVTITAAGHHSEVEVTYRLTPLSGPAAGKLREFAGRYPAYLQSWQDAITARLSAAASAAGHVPPASAAADVPPASAAGHVPPASAAAHVPPASAAGHVPPASAAGHVPPASAAGHDPGALPADTTPNASRS